MGKKLDLKGQKFGRLTALRAIARDDARQASSCNGVVWLFRCDCGKEKAILGSYVKNGVVISCGCAQRCNSQKSLLKRLRAPDQERFFERLERQREYDEDL